MLGDCYDDLIWDVIGSGSCAYKLKAIKPGTFLCTSSDSVSGRCEKSACPLANAQYATIREVSGRIVLSIKVIERQHTPAEAWEDIELPADYEEAYKLVKKHLKYWEPHWSERCLLKLKKIREYHQRDKQERLKVAGRVKAIKKKQERREGIRQAKALRAARVEATVEKELLKQLQAGKYSNVISAHLGVQLKTANIQDVQEAEMHELHEAEENREIQQV